ncbi:hypothetical protein E1091_07870 [Micromonospora fluostatini]|uniref:Uncharacterized protein n=1 Tax=Micromonospora fluostatini TaxID=1629071 RepID=A0ABY2DI30_9ACTN|nr:hypothetical protein E1091_07870 [Micromonospora fluostatini]
MRLQTLWLPRADKAQPFALIVDRVVDGTADEVVERNDALYEFGRDIGAAGVFITSDTVELPDTSGVPDPEPEPAAEGAPVAQERFVFTPGTLTAARLRTWHETRDRRQGPGPGVWA